MLSNFFLSITFVQEHLLYVELLYKIFVKINVYPKIVS